MKRLLWGKFNNSGQICVAPDYILCSKVGEHWYDPDQNWKYQFWLKREDLCLSVVFVDVFSRGDRGETDPCDEKSPATVLRREARGFKGLLQNRWAGTANVSQSIIVSSTPAVGRVEKSKNGIQSCPKCFLGVFWYKLTGNFFFWSTKIFSWVEFHLKIWDLGLFSDFCTFFSTGKKLNSYWHCVQWL